MKNTIIFTLVSCSSIFLYGQDLSQGLIANDLMPHAMQPLAKPGYLQSVVDPSFGTTIIRITDAGSGETIRTMYSTIQAWNADETRMILYKRPGGTHILLDGFSYQYIRDLNINPSDIEEVYWHFEDPDLLYYLDNNNQDLVEYNVVLDSKTTLVNLRTLSGCTEGMESGNDVQMMSWDSDIFTFRCGNTSTYAYTISTGVLDIIAVTNLNFTAAMPLPSGQKYLHTKDIYNSDGTYDLTLDIESGNEHSCIGKDSGGNDQYYAVAFAQSPGGGCLGEVIAYDPATGACTTIVGTELGYAYPQSGTHISSLAHKNTEGGWLVASMIGYDQDGQDLLDQELLIAQVNPNSSNVYRIAHHRSDEDEYNYWGEPHPVMSPSGTRVLFNSDWSGSDDGFAVDAYVVELPAYTTSTALNEEINLESNSITIFPNPVESKVYIKGISGNYNVRILDATGNVYQTLMNISAYSIDIEDLPNGLFFLEIQKVGSSDLYLKKILKQ